MTIPSSRFIETQGKYFKKSTRKRRGDESLRKIMPQRKRRYRPVTKRRLHAPSSVPCKRDPRFPLITLLANTRHPSTSRLNRAIAIRPYKGFRWEARKERLRSDDDHAAPAYRIAFVIASVSPPADVIIRVATPTFSTREAAKPPPSP